MSDDKTAASKEISGDPDEIDYDDPRFNQGVEYVVAMLARTIGAEGWHAGDGSEDYDCDLEETLRNILAARGLYDRDTGEFLAPEAAPTREEIIEQCAAVVGNMRQSEAGRFDDAKYAGQRGCDRSDALYDAYRAILALKSAPAK